MDTICAILRPIIVVFLNSNCCIGETSHYRFFHFGLFKKSLIENLFFRKHVVKGQLRVHGFTDTLFIPP